MRQRTSDIGAWQTARAERHADAAVIVPPRCLAVLSDKAEPPSGKMLQPREWQNRQDEPAGT